MKRDLDGPVKKYLITMEVYAIDRKQAKEHLAWIGPKIIRVVQARQEQGREKL